MTGFESNLLAGAIILVVDLFVTYVIIVKVIEARDKRIWKPARKRVMQALIDRCDLLMFGWSIVQHQQGPADTQGEVSLVETFRDEIAFLLANRERMTESRDTSYWRNQLRNLIFDREAMSTTLDRVQITLRDEPELVRAITEYEQAMLSVSELHEFLNEETSSGRVTMTPKDFATEVAAVVVPALVTLLDMRDACVTALNK